MYRLRYEGLPVYEKQFGGKISVVEGDTDSFFLTVRGISISQQLLPAMAKDGLLDSSNYPHDHSLYSSVAKVELGRIKDECAGVAIQEAVFLRPKCYSLLLSSQKSHKRAKGIQRCVLQNHISHSDYVNVCVLYVSL